MTCGTELGSEDWTSGGIKLLKWSLAVLHGEQLVSFPVQCWFAAQLLAAIDNEGTRRFHVEEEASDQGTGGKAMLLWVFTDDLNFSSSVDQTCRQDPTRAMKILWREASPASTQESSTQLAVDQVFLPSKVFGEIEGTLRSSAALLPAASRMFKAWNVGLVKRFRVRDFVPTKCEATNPTH